jgi:TonB family protein
MLVMFTGARAVHAQPSTAPLTPPALKDRAEAVYPPEALRERLEAVVEVEIVVDETGAVTDAHVVAPAGHGFDEAAVAALRRFTFVPAHRGDRAIRSTIRVQYAFHLPPLPPPPPPPVAPPPEPLQRGADQSTLVVASRPVVPTLAASPPVERNAASESTTDQSELSLRPRFRAEGMLEVVPGVFSVQHAGGGKAQQDFARGFNLDHGTDMAFFVDDVPVNAVSHAHGQGYSDLHFLIPETVARIDSTKGTYAADVGDFGTAGSTRFRMADHVGESTAKLELAPSTGHERFVVVESPGLGKGWRAVLAAEGFHEDGPFIHPEDFSRFNGYVKITRELDARSELSATAMAYGGTWNMSGVLPARAVCGEGDGTRTPADFAGSRCLSRWDSLDPTQGGNSHRVMGELQYRRQLDERWSMKASAYALHSDLQLFPNDGIFASFQPEGTIFGSQIEQDDDRMQSGGSVSVTNRTELAGVPLRTTVGLQLRDDAIHSQLHRTQARRRLDGIDPGLPGPLYDGHTDESEVGLYAEEAARLTPWLRLVLGLRADRVDAHVTNLDPKAVDVVDGTVYGEQLSPKASAIFSPVDALDVFANYGMGFHTNDARTLNQGSQTTLVVPAQGYEVGTTVRPLRGLSLSTVLFLVDLASELTIDGDTAATSPAGSTERYGLEVTGRYDLDARVYADVTFTAAHGRFTDAADVAAGTVYLPDAPITTLSAGLGARQPFGPVTAIGGVTLRSMSDRFGDPGPTPLVEKGWTVVNAEAGARWRNVELVADLFNVADTAWREGQFEVASILPGQELAAARAVRARYPAPGISFTPGMPRTLMVRAAVYW